MPDDLHSGLISMVDNNFQDLEDAIVAVLPESDKQYADLKARENELKGRFPKIERWLEEKCPLTLSADEHSGLVEYLELNSEMEGIERLAIYYAGHRDCIAYLRKIGAL